MKFFNSKKKIAILGIILTTMIAGTLAYAAGPIRQDAYYDTFKFVVNGTDQFISDSALKPFIANNRVYVPMATLKNLGIAKVDWIANGNQTPTLSVSPAVSSADPAQLTALQQQVAILTSNLNTKDLENKTLLQENSDLKAEIAKLKSTTTTPTTGSNGTLSDAKIKELEDFYYTKLYRNSFEQTYRDGETYKTLDLEFDAKVEAYRNELDIELVAVRDYTDVAWDLSVGKDSYEFERYLKMEVLDEALNRFKDVNDLRINIVVYGGNSRTGAKIATGVYDRGRFNVTIY